MDLFDILKSTRMRVWYLNGSFTVIDNKFHHRLTYNTLSDILPFDVYIPSYIGRMRFSTDHGSYIQANDVVYNTDGETFYEFYNRAIDIFERMYNDLQES